MTQTATTVRFIWNHPANRHRRLRQLARAFSYQVQARAFHRRVQARVGDRAQVWVDLHRTSASKAFYANPPDWPQTRVWQERLRPGDLFLDIGANVGTYSVLAVSLGATVMAVEAASDTAELLRENIALNGFALVGVVQAAAGSVAGKTRFTEGLDSVNRIDPAGVREVDMVTVDALIGQRSVAGMKVDVEGFELHVLQGAACALREHRIELLQLEWNEASKAALGVDRSPVEALLTEHGYQLLHARRRNLGPGRAIRRRARPLRRSDNALSSGRPTG